MYTLKMIKSTSLIAVAFIALTAGSEPVYAQSVSWPVVKTCGRALTSSPISGYMWAGSSLSNQSPLSTSGITHLTSADSGKTAIKVVYDPTGAYYLTTASSTKPDVLFLSQTSSSVKINAVNRNEQVTDFSFDDKQLTWYDMVPLVDAAQYRVLALDKDNYLYVLTTSITNKVTILSSQKIPDSAMSIGAISTLFYMSPDGQFVAYGNVDNMAVYSIQSNRVIISGFHVNDYNFDRLSWGTMPKVLAFSAVGSVGSDWRIFSLGYDGSSTLLIDLKPIVDSGSYTNLFLSNQNDAGQLIASFAKPYTTSSVSNEHLFIIDVVHQQIHDTCIDVSDALISWIDSTHFYITGTDSNSSSNSHRYSLIVSVGSNDYYRIDYPDGIFPLRWVNSSQAPDITSIPIATAAPVQPTPTGSGGSAPGGNQING